VAHAEPVNPPLSDSMKSVESEDPTHLLPENVQEEKPF